MQRLERRCCAHPRTERRAPIWSKRPGLLGLDDTLFAGFYPRIHDRGLDPAQWLDGYVRTYVERDARLVGSIGDLGTFTRFVALCAGRSGQLLNLSALGADAGVSHTTARAWLSVLEASYLVALVKPHHVNFNKRVVKTPKLVFLDSGLLCRLLGLRRAADLAVHPLRGAVFERKRMTPRDRDESQAGDFGADDDRFSTCTRSSATLMAGRTSAASRVLARPRRTSPRRAGTRASRSMSPIGRSEKVAAAAPRYRLPSTTALWPTWRSTTC